MINSLFATSWHQAFRSFPLNVCCEYMIFGSNHKFSIKTTLLTPTYTGTPYPFSQKCIYFSLPNTKIAKPWRAQAVGDRTKATIL